MKNALEIKNLCKSYSSFALENISFTLPQGCVMGFIGENGAGKTTTIKAILNLIHRDSGDITVLGMDNRTDEHEMKQRIGVVLEDSSFPAFYRARDVNAVLQNAYKAWHPEQFFSYLKRFQIDERKKISEYSKGMRMKLSIAAALSHEAELLLLDEPTSGLDPIIRGEVLDLFWEFLQNEEHSVLMSSHITSDLDKIADYVTFIHEGRILLSERRDNLLDTLGILKCTAEQLHALDPAAVKARRVRPYGAEALVCRNMIYGNYTVEAVNIEQIMLFYTRGDHE
ncbi:MAG: ABC transporter ATP-binding protein [Intestinibacillus sp.]